MQLVISPKHRHVFLGIAIFDILQTSRYFDVDVIDRVVLKCDVID